MSANKQEDMVNALLWIAAIVLGLVGLIGIALGLMTK